MEYIVLWPSLNRDKTNQRTEHTIHLYMNSQQGKKERVERTQKHFTFLSKNKQFKKDFLSCKNANF